MSAGLDALERDAARRTRQLVTPEGTPLTLRIGDAGERAAAFFIDALIIVAALIALLLTGVAVIGASGGAGAEFAASFMLLGFFVLRGFYFMAFEMGPAAATPGKRLFRLRVAARDGGRLTTDMVFARNAMRELEVFLPLTFLLSNPQSVDALTALAGIVWTSAFVFFPLFNRDRLRAGDLIAGTWVIKNPKPVLLADLSEHARQSDGYEFSQAQLSYYGEHELTVLENVLRRGDPATLAAVAERIRGKIGWNGHAGETDAVFLNAYYRALRQRLEAGLLFGRRRKNKYDDGRPV
ncbi:MAG: RDD family protein [Hyphomonadaceae bacterium]